MLTDLEKCQIAKAADLLAQPGKWTQGEYARDAEGHDLYYRLGGRPGWSRPTGNGGDHPYVDATPICFCAIGALIEASGSIDAASKLSSRVWDVAYDDSFISLPDWNDAQERTQDEVVAAFREVAGC